MTMSALPQLEARQIEVLDLRHFSAASLRPLLRDEAERWQRRLRWDYTQASNVILDYLEGRILPGFVAVEAQQRNHILGYAFCVYEGAKAVIGDAYAFDETEAIANPVCESLLSHMLEMLQATPGVDRIESQLLMFPAGALATPYLSRGFRSFSRLFMSCDLTQQVRHPERSPKGAVEGPLDFGSAAKSPPTFTQWQPSFYDAAADLIHRCYVGHMDSQINDQYQTVHGAQRFLHNIIRFPGCGTFDTDNSWVLRDSKTAALQAVLLCSRVRDDVGHITQLCVSPHLRSKGIGQALLNHAATCAASRGLNSISLTVTEANTGALRLYEHNGFATLHRFDAMVWKKTGTGEVSQSSH
jgi:ribosomal protein S18 acetylase RimI-like enzyme